MRTAVLPCSRDGSCGIVQLALGPFHGCARDSDGGVRCWGTDGRGQTGTPPDSDGPEAPRLVALPHPAVTVVAAAHHSCAVLDTGEVWCWGDDSRGQVSGLRTELPRPPVRVDALPGVDASAAAGFGFSCALDSGRGWCWGEPIQSDDTIDPRPRTLRGVFDGTSLAATWQAVCALRGGGGVVCSGSGWLGDGRDVPHSISMAISVRGLTDAVAIAAGPAHFCARRADRTVVCWGRNGYGQLGNGTRETAPEPVVVPGLRDIVAIAAGGIGADASDDAAHTCALDEGGRVWCWGANDSGQLGDGTREDRYSPVRAVLAGDETVVEVAAGGGVTCVRTVSFLVRCIGGRLQPGFTVETRGDAGPGGSGG